MNITHVDLKGCLKIMLLTSNLTSQSSILHKDAQKIKDYLNEWDIITTYN